jgi:hypothetical protein
VEVLAAVLTLITLLIMALAIVVVAEVEPVGIAMVPPRLVGLARLVKEIMVVKVVRNIMQVEVAALVLWGLVAQTNRMVVLAY